MNLHVPQTEEARTEAIELMGSVARSPAEKGALRAGAVRALAKSGKPAALDAAVTALTSAAPAPAEMVSAWEDFAREPRNGRNVAYFTKLASESSAERRTLGWAVLANLARESGETRTGTAARDALARLERQGE